MSESEEILSILHEYDNLKVFERFLKFLRENYSEQQINELVENLRRQEDNESFRMMGKFIREPGRVDKSHSTATVAIYLYFLLNLYMRDTKSKTIPRFHHKCSEDREFYREDLDEVAVPHVKDTEMVCTRLAEETAIGYSLERKFLENLHQEKLEEVRLMRSILNPSKYQVNAANMLAGKLTPEAFANLVSLMYYQPAKLTHVELRSVKLIPPAYRNMVYPGAVRRDPASNRVTHQTSRLAQFRMLHDLSIAFAQFVSVTNAPNFKGDFFARRSSDFTLNTLLDNIGTDSDRWNIESILGSVFKQPEFSISAYGEEEITYTDKNFMLIIEKEYPHNFVVAKEIVHTAEDADVYVVKLNPEQFPLHRDLGPGHLVGVDFRFYNPFEFDESSVRIFFSFVRAVLQGDVIEPFEMNFELTWSELKSALPEKLYNHRLAPSISLKTNSYTYCRINKYIGYGFVTEKTAGVFYLHKEVLVLRMADITLNILLPSIHACQHVLDTCSAVMCLIPDDQASRYSSNLYEDVESNTFNYNAIMNLLNYSTVVPQMNENTEEYLHWVNTTSNCSGNFTFTYSINRNIDYINFALDLFKTPLYTNDHLSFSTETLLKIAGFRRVFDKDSLLSPRVTSILIVGFDMNIVEAAIVTYERIVVHTKDFLAVPRDTLNYYVDNLDMTSIQYMVYAFTEEAGVIDIQSRMIKGSLRTGAISYFSYLISPNKSDFEHSEEYRKLLIAMCYRRGLGILEAPVFPTTPTPTSSSSSSSASTSAAQSSPYVYSPSFFPLSPSSLSGWTTSERIDTTTNSPPFEYHDVGYGHSFSIYGGSPF
jgi:hypothetical protein